MCLAFACLEKSFKGLNSSWTTATTPSLHQMRTSGLRWNWRNSIVFYHNINPACVSSSLTAPLSSVWIPFVIVLCRHVQVICFLTNKRWSLQGGSVSGGGCMSKRHVNPTASSANVFGFRKWVFHGGAPTQTCLPSSWSPAWRCLHYCPTLIVPSK